jgi:HEAT repeat protein
MEQLSPQLMNRLVFSVIMHGLNDAQTNLALNVLTDALRHENQNIRELAVVALADLSLPSQRRVPAISSAMGDPSARVRRRAARALGDQGHAAAVAFPALRAGLRDSDLSVRRDCAGAIGRLGPTAAGATFELVALLGDADDRTRAVVAVALKRIGQTAVPALLAGMRANSANLRGRCATLLAKIAPDNPEVESMLSMVLADEDAEVRARADEAIQLVRTPAPQMLAI